MRKTRDQRLKPQQPNHVVCRGNNRRRLFSYPADYLDYLRLLDTGRARFGCKLHALCLMSNHVHLLITPPTIEAASNMMQRVNQRYAQIRNQKHRGSGKLFEQRFESEPVENERHLAYCVLYINANPYAASMPNMKNYRWSTQSLHCGQQGSDISEGFITHDHWYSALGENPIDRAASYHEIFENYLAGKLDSGFVEQEYAERTTRMEPRRAGWPPRRPDGTSAREAFAKYAKNTMQNSELDA